MEEAKEERAAKAEVEEVMCLQSEGEAGWQEDLEGNLLVGEFATEDIFVLFNFQVMCRSTCFEILERRCLGSQLIGQPGISEA